MKQFAPRRVTEDGATILIGCETTVINLTNRFWNCQVRGSSKIPNQALVIGIGQKTVSGREVSIRFGNAETTTPQKTDTPHFFNRYQNPKLL
jgi:hypothetical protein